MEKELNVSVKIWVKLAILRAKNIKFDIFHRFFQNKFDRKSGCLAELVVKCKINQKIQFPHESSKFFDYKEKLKEFKVVIMRSTRCVQRKSKDSDSSAAREAVRQGKRRQFDV